MYLDERRIAEQVAMVSYKPGWMFTLHRHDFEGLCLDIAVTMPSRDDYHKSVDLNVRTPIPPIVSTDHFHDWLLWRLARVETHELREFYRRNGELVDDPHREQPMMS